MGRIIKEDKNQGGKFFRLTQVSINGYVVKTFVTNTWHGHTHSRWVVCKTHPEQSHFDFQKMVVSGLDYESALAIYESKLKTKSRP